MYESLFVRTVLVTIRRRLIGACDLIFESAPILIALAGWMATLPRCRRTISARWRQTP
jgi:hypothetical protein